MLHFRCELAFNDELYFIGGTALAYYLKLENELRKIFNAKIDLINYKKLNPLIKLHSQKEFIYV